jgi:hypothetical protein
MYAGDIQELMVCHGLYFQIQNSLIITEHVDINHSTLAVGIRHAYG